MDKSAPKGKVYQSIHKENEALKLRLSEMEVDLVSANKEKLLQLAEQASAGNRRLVNSELRYKKEESEWLKEKEKLVEERESLKQVVASIKVDL